MNRELSAVCTYACAALPGLTSLSPMLLGCLIVCLVWPWQQQARAELIGHWPMLRLYDYASDQPNWVDAQAPGLMYAPPTYTVIDGGREALRLYGRAQSVDAYGLPTSADQLSIAFWFRTRESYWWSSENRIMRFGDLVFEMQHRKAPPTGRLLRYHSGSNHSLLGSSAFDLPNPTEWQHCTITFADGDGISDALELALQMDPLDAADGAIDFNGDGRSNALAVADGADPLGAFIPELISLGSQYPFMQPTPAHLITQLGDKFQAMFVDFESANQRYLAGSYKTYDEPSQDFIVRYWLRDYQGQVSWLPASFASYEQYRVCDLDNSGQLWLLLSNPTVGGGFNRDYQIARWSPTDGLNLLPDTPDGDKVSGYQLTGNANLDYAGYHSGSQSGFSIIDSVQFTDGGGRARPEEITENGIILLSRYYHQNPNPIAFEIRNGNQWLDAIHFPPMSRAIFTGQALGQGSSVGYYYHAQDIAANETVVGRITYNEESIWENLIEAFYFDGDQIHLLAPADIDYRDRPRDKPMRMSREVDSLGVSDQGLALGYGWLDISPNFRVAPFSSNDLRQDQTYFLQNGCLSIPLEHWLAEHSDYQFEQILRITAGGNLHSYATHNGELAFVRLAADRDRDGLPDHLEYQIIEQLGGHLTLTDITPQLDSDQDGLSDWQEILLGTNPNNPDNDGDGSSDFAELLAGANPNDPGDAQLADISELDQFLAQSYALIPLNDVYMQTYDAWGPGIIEFTESAQLFYLDPQERQWVWQGGAPHLLSNAGASEVIVDVSPDGWILWRNTDPYSNDVTYATSPPNDPTARLTLPSLDPQAFQQEVMQMLQSRYPQIGSDGSVTVLTSASIVGSSSRPDAKKITRNGIVTGLVNSYMTVSYVLQTTSDDGYDHDEVTEQTEIPYGHAMSHWLPVGSASGGWLEYGEPVGLPFADALAEQGKLDASAGLSQETFTLGSFDHSTASIPFIGSLIDPVSRSGYQYASDYPSARSFSIPNNVNHLYDLADNRLAAGMNSQLQPLVAYLSAYGALTETISASLGAATCVTENGIIGGHHFAHNGSPEIAYLWKKCLNSSGTMEWAALNLQDALPTSQTKHRIHQVLGLIQAGPHRASAIVSTTELDENGTQTLPKAALLMPVEIKPNPMPATGVARSKFFLAAANKDTMPVVTDENTPTITIEGVPCENVRQDEIDPRIFYFTPPESPTEAAGKFDCEISGITVPDHPFLSNGYPLTMTDFVEYTDDASDGTKGFRDSNIVAWEEVQSIIEGAAEQGSMTADEANETMDRFADRQARDQSGLAKIFFDGKTIDHALVEDYERELDPKIAAFEADYPVSPPNTPEFIFPTGMSVEPLTGNVDEGESAIVRFLRPTVTAQPQTVHYEVGGTATAGEDYDMPSGTIVIGANAQFADLEIPIPEDGEVDAEETLTIALKSGIGYDVAFFDKATIVLHDAGQGNGGQQLVAPQQQAAPNPPVPQGPQFGPTFFANAKSLLARSTKSTLLGTAMYTNPDGNVGKLNYAVFDADALNLEVETTATAGDTIADILASYPEASIALNGAQFNFGDKEPLTTIGLVLHGGARLPTSTNAAKDSWETAIKRYWFGQTFDKTAAKNAGRALSYKFDRGNPPEGVYIDRAMGGLTSLILKGVAQTPADDAELNTYEAGWFTKPSGNIGKRVRGAAARLMSYNIVGIDRDTGLLMVASKRLKEPILLKDAQEGLIVSGCDEALVTDGGGSVACWARGWPHAGGYLSRERRQMGDPPEAQTVTSYILFSPK